MRQMTQQALGGRLLAAGRDRPSSLSRDSSLFLHLTGVCSHHHQQAPPQPASTAKYPRDMSNKRAFSGAFDIADMEATFDNFGTPQACLQRLFSVPAN